MALKMKARTLSGRSGAAAPPGARPEKHQGVLELRHDFSSETSSCYTWRLMLSVMLAGFSSEKSCACFPEWEMGCGCFLTSGAVTQ